MLWFLTSSANLAEYFQVSMRGLVVVLDDVVTAGLDENVEGLQKLKGEPANDVFARLRTFAEDFWVVGCLVG